MARYIGLIGKNAMIIDNLFMFIAVLLGFILLSLAIIDLRSYFLPNTLILALAVAAIADNVLFPELSPFARISAALIGGGIFWGIGTLYHHFRDRSGLGFGDVKFVAASGLWLGPVDLPMMISLAAIFGILHALLLSLRYKVTRTTPIPFGTSMALSFWIIWLATRYGL